MIVFKKTEQRELGDVKSKDWVLSGEKMAFLGDVGSVTWSTRVLVGLSMWTVKLLGMVAGVGEERNIGTTCQSTLV